jgi:chaperone required for assembly of F1-ATPase
MRDILYPVSGPSDPNPMKRAQAAMARQPLPRRFYSNVEIQEREGAYAIHLDGRLARTPGRNPLALATRRAAEMLAAEWKAQVDVLDPGRMHATRIANTGIDSIGQRLAEVQADVAAYAATDLVCYRAGEPDGLMRRQRAAWDPVVDWAHSELGARVVLAEGIMHQEQDDAVLSAIRARVATEREPVRLAALHVLTTMSGSCLIALMMAAGALSADAAWAASLVDEDWNADLWGRDAEAEALRALRRNEFDAAAALLAALR